MGLTQKEFNFLYKDTPIFRSKWKGYLRNVAVALGNSGDPTVLHSLNKAIQWNEPLIREHALWAIDKIEREAHIQE
jgi:epoxyqueuosine reductase